MVRRGVARRMGGFGRRGERGRRRRPRGGLSYLLDYANASFSRSSEAAAVDPRDGWAFYDLVTPWPGVDVLRQPEAAHALIEGGRTNLITYSADFTNAAWVKGGTPSPAVSAAAAPDGGAAYDLTDNAAAHEFVEITATLTVTGDHTVSAYFLKDSVTTRFPGLRIAAGTATLATSSSHEVHLNTQTGATAGRFWRASPSSGDRRGDWWRVSFVVTATVTGTVVVDVLPAGRRRSELRTSPPSGRPPRGESNSRRAASRRPPSARLEPRAHGLPSPARSAQRGCRRPF
ncbi:MAG: hypothetical protein SangKO_075850 [Sandaracinaceae bacterium]